MMPYGTTEMSIFNNNNNNNIIINKYYILKKVLPQEIKNNIMCNRCILIQLFLFTAAIALLIACPLIGLKLSLVVHAKTAL